MADQEHQGNEKKEAESGVLGRLAGRGEDAVTRLMDELGRNTVVTDALARAMSAKGRVDEATRKTLSQVGLGPGEELEELRNRVRQLEQRLITLEQGTSSASARKPRAKGAGGTSAGPASGGSKPPDSTRARPGGPSSPRGGSGATGGPPEGP